MTKKRSSPLGLELLVSLTLASLAILPLLTQAAPLQEYTEIQQYSEGCYYNYAHYNEGDRILTNEPCLNCTCHNRMLMCYLRVCPFTKPIGHDCIVEKREDQCCPIITCPEVPVDVPYHTPEPGTELSIPEKFGCSIEEKFYPEGAQVPSNPNKPCELCYCINNQTKCVMQECTLHVDGCTPIYNRGSCCPVRYSCDHENDVLELEDESTTTTTVRPTPGFILTTTMTPSVSTDCVHDGAVYADGASLTGKNACEHCYCMRGDIVCAVQECEMPMMAANGKSCRAMPAIEGECCPSNYVCDDDSTTTEIIEASTQQIGKDEGETTTTAPAKDIHGEIPKEDVDLQEHIDDEEKPKEDKESATESSTDEIGSGEIDHIPTKTKPVHDIDDRLGASEEEHETSTVTADAKIDPWTLTSTIPSVEKDSEDRDIVKPTTSAEEGSGEKDIAKPTTTASVEEGSEEVETARPTLASEKEGGEEDAIRITTSAPIEKGSGEVATDRPTSSTEKDSAEEEAKGTTFAPAEQGSGAVEAVRPTTEKDVIEPTTSDSVEEGSGEDETVQPTSSTEKDSAEKDAIEPTTSASVGKVGVQEDVSEPTSVEEGSGEDDSLKPKAPSPIGSVEEDSEKTTTPKTSEEETDVDSTTDLSAEQGEDEGEDEHVHTTGVPHITPSTEHISAEDTTEGISAEEKPEAESSTSAPERAGDKEDETSTEPISKGEEKDEEQTEKTTEVKVPSQHVPEESSTTEATSTEKTDKEEIDEESSTLAAETEIVPSVSTPLEKHDEPSEGAADKDTTTQQAPLRSDISTSGEIDQGTAQPDASAEVSTDKPQATYLPPSVAPIGSTDKIDVITETPDVSGEPQDHTTLPVSQDDSAKPTEIAPTVEDEPTVTVVAPVQIGDRDDFVTEADIGETTVAPSSDEESTSAALPDMEIPAVIPGEGDCLVDGKTYANNTLVPATTLCDTSCKCISSIVACKQVECDLPENRENCVLSPNWLPTESCCPTYICNVDTSTTRAEESDEVVRSTTITPQSSEKPIDRVEEELGATTTEGVPKDIIMPSGITDQPLSHIKPDEGISHVTTIIPDLEDTTTPKDIKKPTDETVPEPDHKIISSTIIPDTEKEASKPAEEEISHTDDVTKQPTDEILSATAVPTTDQTKTPSEEKYTTIAPLADAAQSSLFTTAQTPIHTEEEKPTEGKISTQEETTSDTTVAPFAEEASTESSGETIPPAGVPSDTFDKEPEDKYSTSTIRTPVESITEPFAQSTSISPETQTDDSDNFTTAVPSTEGDSSKPVDENAPSTSAEVDESTEDSFAAPTVQPQIEDMQDVKKVFDKEQLPVTQSTEELGEDQDNEIKDDEVRPSSEIQPTKGEDSTTQVPSSDEEGEETSDEVSPTTTGPSTSAIEEEDKSDSATVVPSQEDKEPAIPSTDEIQPQPEDRLDSTTVIPSSESEKPVEEAAPSTISPSKDGVEGDKFDSKAVPSSEGTGQKPVDDKISPTSAPSDDETKHDLPATSTASSIESEDTTVATESIPSESTDDSTKEHEPEDKIAGTAEPPTVAGAEGDDTDYTTDHKFIETTEGPTTEKKDTASIPEVDVDTTKPAGDSIATTSTPSIGKDEEQEGELTSQTTAVPSELDTTSPAALDVPAAQEIDKKPMDEVLSHTEDKKTAIDDESATPAPDAVEEIASTIAPATHDIEFSTEPSKQPAPGEDVQEETSEPSTGQPGDVDRIDEAFEGKLQPQTTVPTVPEILTESPVVEPETVAQTIGPELEAAAPGESSEAPESDIHTTEHLQQDKTTAAPVVVPSLDSTEEGDDSVESEEEHTTGTEHKIDESEASTESEETITESASPDQDTDEIPAVVSEIPQQNITAAPPVRDETSTEPSRLAEDAETPTEQDIATVTTLHPLFAQHLTSTTTGPIIADRVDDDGQTTPTPVKQSPESTTSASTTELPLTTTAASIHYEPITPPSYGQPPQYPSYPEDEYDEEEVFGPGTCRYAGKLYVSAQQIPRDDPCDFCFCFRSDIICLQQSCPPPIAGCHEEPISGFCCPRYECPVSMAAVLNITTSTTTTSTTLPPHFLTHSYGDAVERNGCLINGRSYKVGEPIESKSGPCISCTCGGDGKMKCDPQLCVPEPTMQEVMAAVVSSRKR